VLDEHDTCKTLGMHAPSVLTSQELLGIMSGVRKLRSAIEVRTAGPHSQGSATPHSHSENKMGRPVAFSASRIALYLRAGPQDRLHA
jgi:hypothetical protein